MSDPALQELARIVFNCVLPARCSHSDKSRKREERSVQAIYEALKAVNDRDLSKYKIELTTSDVEE